METAEGIQSVFGGQSYIGIPLALLGAVFLSGGTQYQHRGIAKIERLLPDGAGFWSQLRGMLLRPSWLFGTLMLGLAIVFQLSSLWFAPLIVVQPLGAISLVITALLNARITRIPLDRATITAIVLSVSGVGVFVLVAAFVASPQRVDQTQLITVLVSLLALLAFWLVLGGVMRRRRSPVLFVIAAGTLFGFVVTLAKVAIGRVQTLMESEWQFGVEEWLTVACVAGLIVASLVGSWFVQKAHATGPPDLVVAGLTVVDPIVAVTIGMLVLGEAAHAPAWAFFVFGVAGAVAVFGVFLLARHHPQMQDGTFETGPLGARGRGEPAAERADGGADGT